MAGGDGRRGGARRCGQRGGWRRRSVPVGGVSLARPSGGGRGRRALGRASPPSRLRGARPTAAATPSGTPPLAPRAGVAVADGCAIPARLARQTPRAEVAPSPVTQHEPDTATTCAESLTNADRTPWTPTVSSPNAPAHGARTPPGWPRPPGGSPPTNTAEATPFVITTSAASGCRVRFRPAAPLETVGVTRTGTAPSERTCPTTSTRTHDRSHARRSRSSS